MSAYLIAAEAFAQNIATDAGAVVERERDGATIESLGLGVAAGAMSAGEHRAFFSKLFSRVCKSAR